MVQLTIRKFLREGRPVGAFDFEIRDDLKSLALSTIRSINNTQRRGGTKKFPVFVGHEIFTE